MSSYYFKNTKYNTIGYSHLRDIQSKRDKFTVLPEFGITVFDADNPPFERDNNYRVHDVYAHIPSRESQIQKRGAYQANQSLTTMYKRKAPSNAYNNARFDAEFGPSAPVAHKKARTELQMRAASQQSAWKSQASLSTQVRRLIQAKKKDAADVTRYTANTFVTTLMCATSSTANATAADTTGLVVADSDRASINHLDCRGVFTLDPIASTTAQSLTVKGEAEVRLIWVWYYKPSTQSSAAGTLPPITDFLVSDDINAMYIQDAANSGRFQVLSDRRWNVGRALQLSDSSLGQSGRGPINAAFNYRVKVNKVQSYKAVADNTNKGGHYDSDTGAGQVTKGLMVGYLIGSKGLGVAGTDAGILRATLITRLNYTA